MTQFTTPTDSAQNDGNSADQHEDTSPIPVPKTTVIDYALSGALWGLGVSWLLPLTLLQTGLFQFIPSHKLNFLPHIFTAGSRILTLSKWRAVVHPKVDPKTPYMFLQNHVNLLDFAWLYNATPHYKQGVENEDHFKIPLYGWFMKARGTIPVKRGATGQTSEVLAHVRRNVEYGNSILACPEGSRTPNGRVGKFRKGLFFLSRDAGLPIVPVSIVGAHEVMRKGSNLMRPFQDVTIYVDEPIETAGLTDDEIAELTEHVRNIIVKRVNDHWAKKFPTQGTP